MTHELARTVLVTGGTGSVGEDLVVGFAKAGYAVTFLYSRSTERARELTRNAGATAVQVDLMRSTDLADKEIDILINNAAINDSSQCTRDLPLDAWNRAIAVNLTAPFRLIQQCLPYMMNREIITNT